MLPYTPLHHLLARRLAAPFVLTSGNVSDEPIAFRDEDAFARLGGLAAAFLYHDRAVHTRTDDSVVTVDRGRASIVRRSRGYAPSPLALPLTLPRPVLACGAELKNTFCLAKGGRAFISPHIGDLENYPTLVSYRQGVDHMSRLFDVSPAVVAHDLHPEYLSTKYALAREGVDLVGVQHHHAHIASCLADNAYTGPVIGLAFDGLGLGDDGTLWGGEVLLANLAGYRRLGHLREVRMPGGAAAIREPWRMAVAYLEAAYEGNPPGGLALARRHGPGWGPVAAIAGAGLASPLTTSAGRLFDAVSALVAGRDTINYEGQAAVELELLADPAEGSAYDIPLGPCAHGGAHFELDGPALVRMVAEGLLAGDAPDRLAARFHNSLARAAVAACQQARRVTGLDVVALSGGVFQNLLLSGMAREGLEEAGFRVLSHRDVPTNDGGISLGQAVVAGAGDAGWAGPSAP